MVSGAEKAVGWPMQMGLEHRVELGVEHRLPHPEGCAGSREARWRGKALWGPLLTMLQLSPGTPAAHVTRSTCLLTYTQWP